jgi:hypothetical protein
MQRSTGAASGPLVAMATERDREGPAAPARRSRRLAGALFVASLGLVVLAGCGSDDDEIGESSTTTEASADDTTTTALGGDGDGEDDGSDDGGDDTTTTSEAAEGGGDIVGTWTADAAAILGANTANLGGAGGLDCTGPVTLDFKANGTFSHTATATCSAAGGMSATATIDSSGSYEVTGDQLQVVAAVNNGSMEVAGTVQEVPIGLTEGQAVDFAVDGDTLTFTFTDASVGTVTQTYTRS